MSKHEKALQRVVSKPADFTWSELVRLLKALDYILESGSGSRRRFSHPGKPAPFYIHEPHPSGILKAYQMRDLIAFLKEENIL